MTLLSFRLWWSGLALLVAVSTATGGQLVHRTWSVDGVTREVLISIPANATKEPVPVVFAFHGHGGSMTQASRSFHLHTLWPEAIVIYPQGLATPSPLVDPAGNMNGWQAAAGLQGDRDLKFFDTMLASLRQDYKVDDKRIYAMGHSNGGGFTYLLWAERGDTFAALAPSSALLAKGFMKFKPKPILHVGSPQDELVKFSWQERMLGYVLKLDGCGPLKPGAIGYTVYPSKSGNDVAVYLHTGGHTYPTDAAPELIVKFFQAHPKS